ncbi:MAG TPA: fatty acid CoA ligase family protein [Pantanalinema sp.]
MTLATHDNVIRYLSHWARVSPSKPALVFPRSVRPGGSIAYSQLSFEELEDRVNRLAAALASRGIGRGDAVVVMIPMSLELYTLLLALLKLAAPIVFIDPWVGIDQIKRCIALTSPKAFAGVPLIQLIGRATGALSGIPLRITARGPARFGEWQLERLIESGGPIVETTAVQADETALITFTTGSTGTPKGANRTHGFLVAQHRALSRELGLTPEDVDLPALPIFILNNLASGVTSVVPLMKPSKPAAIDPGVIVRQIQDWGVTTAVGSPAYFAPIADHCLERGLWLPTVRAVFTGGGPVPPGLLGKLRRVLPNGSAFVGYGSTEAEPVALIEAAEACDETDALSEAGHGTCVGRLAHGITARIIRRIDGPISLGARGWDDVELETGEVGELVVTGEHVGKDYYRNPEAGRENKIRDPEGILWHRMGDVAYFDAQDRLWVVGRVNNAVQRGERTLYPLQVEAIARQLPFVRHAALVGRPGARAMLVVEASEPGALWRRGTWKQAVLAHMAAQGAPVDEVRFIRRMPLDPRHNAKIDHAKLQRLLR